ncbi:T9SS type A sorting domain-containing protein [Sinomicrobium oceani]|uniref:T9SS type A sorting domain-containing protein n=1 Tax=Sinomicrobium oceani TaxID=1150368 RepID=UPI00227B6B05|nr:T9SS type A sorting domain-containing protein [Sinomicrobium oceani]
MEKLLLSFQKSCFLFFFSFAFYTAGAQEITFTYDAAGNQTNRQWVCVNCRTSEDLAKAATLEEASEIPEALQEVAMTDEETLARPLTLYPNPVSSTLYVDWEGDFPVREVQLYGNTGTLVNKNAVAKSQSQAELQFGMLPIGVYVMVVVYEDGHKETRKIIKK